MTEINHGATFSRFRGLTCQFERCMFFKLLSHWRERRDSGSVWGFANWQMEIRPWTWCRYCLSIFPSPKLDRKPSKRERKSNMHQRGCWELLLGNTWLSMSPFKSLFPARLLLRDMNVQVNGFFSLLKYFRPHHRNIQHREGKNIRVSSGGTENVLTLHYRNQNIERRQKEPQHKSCL